MGLRNPKNEADGGIFEVSTYLLRQFINLDYGEHFLKEKMVLLKI